MSEAVVLGSGIAGIAAALDIANHGILVHLVEREPTIGGHMAMLDKTFPTNDCSMCILSPKMVEAARHPLVTLHTCTELTRIEGEEGNFTVSLVRHPRYVIESECTGCGDCVEVCPVEVYNRFDAGIGVRKAIYKVHPQAVPDKMIRDPVHCIDCGLCYSVCGKHAILHDNEDTDREFTLHVAAVVVATGYEVFDATDKRSLKYLTIPDVITSIEFERMINASGPTGGSVRRLSNGASPKRVVFVQCVGSRDNAAGMTSCSCVCCMYAAKNAMLIREKYPDCEVFILYMDIRAYGKGYEEYTERAKNLGVRFIRGMPGEVYGNGTNITVMVENTETRELMKIETDLLVLSVGLRPVCDAGQIAETLGISTDDTGFYESPQPDGGPVMTIRPGIYVAGTCRRPMDIPDAVAEGGAAAMHAVISCMKGRNAAT